MSVPGSNRASSTSPPDASAGAADASAPGNAAPSNAAPDNTADAAAATARRAAAAGATVRQVADDVAAGARAATPYFRRAGAEVASGARTAVPVIRRVGLRVGDWLALIGWGKFVVLAILLLIFANIVSGVFFERGPIVVVDRDSPAEKVNVVVSVSDSGIQIRPGAGAGAPVPPVPPVAPVPPVPPSPATSKPGQEPTSIRIDDSGLRVLTQKDGRRVAIVVDGSGVRIEEPTSADSARRPRALVIDGKSITIPIGPDQDPDRVAESIEAAREKVAEIVNDQVRQQVARSTRVYREQSSDWFMSFVFLLIVTAVIVKVVLGSKKKAETRAQAASQTAVQEGLKRQLAEAQLKMMQAQVEPHFLFNTLASVDYLIETDPARASTMQKNLIQYLRAALPQMREGSTTLGKEVALCRAYLEILKVRMDDRLQFAITVPQGLASAQFPPMMLQSLVENAIKHGLEPKPEGGTLTLAADIAHGSLRVTVADTGLGFGTAGTAGSGVGLANVRERLAALYGGQARLAVQANTPSGTIAVIDVPYVLDTTVNGRSTPADPAPLPA
jgi:hypothetical protein